MNRARHFRAVRVRLECGHEKDLNTSRYRVSADLASLVVMDAVRSGVWCSECAATCMPVASLGVVRA